MSSMAGLLGNSRIVAFSGGCFSGKTTTMEALKKALETKGYKVCMLSELIRNVISEPIDDIRKDPAKYFEVQKKIISEKINQETHAFKVVNDDFIECEHNDVIFLADRAITDSMFYLENYVDKSRLQDSTIHEYCEFHEMLRKYSHDAFRNYSMVVEFKPLENSNNNDTFRPKNIDFLKTYEYSVIHMLNKSHAAECSKSEKQYFICDLNKQSVDTVVEYIISALRLS